MALRERNESPFCCVKHGVRCLGSVVLLNLDTIVLRIVLPLIGVSKYICNLSLTALTQVFSFFP
jgi:hypothetical protein